MSSLREDRDTGWSWPPELAVFDSDRWPAGRAEWHLARCAFAPDKATKFVEICVASDRLWDSNPEAYRRAGYA